MRVSFVRLTVAFLLSTLIEGCDGTMLAQDELAPTAGTDLDPAWLAAARHPQTGLLSRGIRSEEASGYWAILNHVRQVPLSQLKTAAKKFEAERRVAIKNDPRFRAFVRQPDADFPTFVDLFHHADQYHGRPVTFRGHLRRLISFQAGENPYGFRELHEAWLYVEDAQQNPVVIVCSELPAKIPTGSDILVDFVSVTGYFFKKYGYEDRAGQLRFAPLILAHRLNWSPRSRSTEFLSKGQMFGVTVGLSALIALVWWQAVRRARGLRAVLRVRDSDDTTERPPPAAESAGLPPEPKP